MTVPNPLAKADRPLSAPQVLYLALSTSDVCNYRCRHCHIWRHELRSSAVTVADRKRWLAEFAALSPGGVVILTGGEVTLDYGELFEVASASRALGQRLFALSNGLLVDSFERARGIARSGITHMVISLDSHLPEIHNYTRGRERAFEEATGALRLLVRARDEAANGFQVLVSTVLFKENLPLLPDLVTFCRALGVDHLDFQLLGPTFANARPDRDVFFERHFWHTAVEKASARSLFERLLPELGTDGFVAKNATDLPWILRYVEDPSFETSVPVCGSHHRNLILDGDGNATLCFNAEEILEVPAIGNARANGLAEIWTGAPAAAARETMDGCRRACGTLNCHRREGGTAT